MLEIKINTKIGKLFLFFFFLLLVTGTTTAKTFSVSVDGKADYKSIQEAIDAASDGDIIHVYPGTYIENINVSKSLEIKSISSPEDTIIEASKPDYSAVTVMANSVTISGFTISGSNLAGLYLNECHNSTTIENRFQKNDVGILLKLASMNKILDDNVNYNKNGIFLIDSTGNTVANNTINSNGFSGIRIINCSKNMLENNTITQNKYFGIWLGKSTKNILLNNNISSNELIGSSLVESKDNELKNNFVYSNQNSGFLVGMNSSNNIFINNSLEENSFGVVLINSSNNNTFENNSMSKNTIGISLQNVSSNKFHANEISLNELNGIYINNCKDINEFDMNFIKNNHIGAYSENSNDNLTEHNLQKNNVFQGNEDEFENSPTDNLPRLATGLIVIIFVGITLILIKKKISK